MDLTEKGVSPKKVSVPAFVERTVTSSNNSPPYAPTSSRLARYFQMGGKKENLAGAKIYTAKCWKDCSGQNMDALPEGRKSWVNSEQTRLRCREFVEAKYSDDFESTLQS